MRRPLAQRLIECHRLAPAADICAMNRGAHFGIGLGMMLFCGFWCLIGYAWFIGLAISRDSVPGASVFDSSFITLYVVWGSVFLGCLWGAFLSFRRALRLRRRSALPEPPESPISKRQPDLATPDEKLAHLVKRSKDETSA